METASPLRRPVSLGRSAQWTGPSATRRPGQVRAGRLLDGFEGGAVQATSWTLKERARFDRFNATSDTSAIEVEFVAGQGYLSLGIGECAQGPTAAAIANAVYDALGVRVRSLPLTAEQLIAAMPD